MVILYYTILYYTLTYQNLQKSRVPINSILGFIIRTYKKVGFGRLRYFLGDMLYYIDGDVLYYLYLMVPFGILWYLTVPHSTLSAELLCLPGRACWRKRCEDPPLQLQVAGS